MIIYRWDSELLRRYSYGDLIALADSADSARAILRSEFDAWVKENRESVWCDAFDPWNGDEPDRKQYDRLRALFDADIAKAPTEHKTLWMDGSE